MYIIICFRLCSIMGFTFRRLWKKTNPYFNKFLLFANMKDI